MGKSYRVTLCQHNYQMSSVTLLVTLICFNLAALYKTSNSLIYILKFIGAETQAEVKVKGYQNNTLCGTKTMAVFWCNISVESLI